LFVGARDIIETFAWRELSAEKLPIELLCFGDVVGVQLDVNERIGHDGLLERESEPKTCLEHTRVHLRSGHG
jgi:hypothetical protein